MVLPQRPELIDTRPELPQHFNEGLIHETNPHPQYSPQAPSNYPVEYKLHEAQYPNPYMQFSMDRQPILSSGDQIGVNKVHAAGYFKRIGNKQNKNQTEGYRERNVSMLDSKLKIANYLSTYAALYHDDNNLDPLEVFRANRRVEESSKAYRSPLALGHYA